MKKTIIIAALLMFVTSSAFAAVSISITTPLTKATSGLTVYGAATGTASASSSKIGKTSTGVDVGILCVASTGTGYSLVTQHMAGSKGFGSSYDSTSIYAKDVTTIGTALLAVPTAITTADFTSWTAL